MPDLDDLETVTLSKAALGGLVQEVTNARHLLTLLKVKDPPDNFIRRFNYSNRIRTIQSAQSRGCDGYDCEYC